MAIWTSLFLFWVIIFECVVSFQFNFDFIQVYQCVVVFFQFNFDFIQVYRVKEFKFEPPSCSDCGENDEDDENVADTLQSSMQHSVWNCDGEIIEFPSLHVRSVLH